MEKPFQKNRKEETLCGPANPAEPSYQTGLLISEPAQPDQVAPQPAQLSELAQLMAKPA
jgi:hypothetical protein